MGSAAYWEGSSCFSSPYTKVFHGPLVKRPEGRRGKGRSNEGCCSSQKCFGRKNAIACFRNGLQSEPWNYCKILPPRSPTSAFVLKAKHLILTFGVKTANSYNIAMCIDILVSTELPQIHWLFQFVTYSLECELCQFHWLGGYLDVATAVRLGRLG